MTGVPSSQVPYHGEDMGQHSEEMSHDQLPSIRVSLKTELTKQ